MKNGSKIFLVILSLLTVSAIIGVLIYFLYPSVQPQEFIPPTCSATTSGTRTNSYTCGQGDSGVDSCSATVTLNCNQQSSDRIVIARTDNFELSQGWFAYANVLMNALETYTFTHPQSACSGYDCTSYIKNQNVSNSIFKDFYYSRTLRKLYISTGGQYTYYYTYGSCSSFPSQRTTPPLCNSGDTSIGVSLEYCGPPSGRRMFQRTCQHISGDPPPITTYCNNYCTQSNDPNAQSPSCGNALKESIAHNSCLDGSGNPVEGQEILCSRCFNPVVYMYEANYVSGVPLTITPLNNCIFPEICDNANTYLCSQQITGAITQTVVYSGQQPGTQQATVSLTPGQTINWNGQFGNQISYIESSTRPSECTRNQADPNDPNQYYLCTLDQDGCGRLDSNPQYCPSGQVYNEENQACGNAYNVALTFQESLISTEEHLIADFYLSGTSNNRGISITASIYKAGQFIPPQKQQLTGNSGSQRGRTRFTFDTLPVGDYILRITFSHPQGNFEQDYNFQVTDVLSVVLTTNHPIQYDDNPIEVILNSFKSGANKALTEYQLQATFNGVNVNPSIVENPSLGQMKFKFDLSNDGILRTRAKGTDETGLWTDWTEWFSIEVKKATILITTDFETDQCMGSITQNFETKDSLGNLVNTQNQVTLDKPLGGTDTASVSGSDGEYSFTYNYAEGGIYTIRITSTNPELGSSQLNQGQGQIINILTGSACGGGGGIGGGIDWTTYIIIGVGVLALIAFVYFVFFFRRKR